MIIGHGRILQDQEIDVANTSGSQPLLNILEYVKADSTAGMCSCCLGTLQKWAGNLVSNSFNVEIWLYIFPLQWEMQQREFLILTPAPGFN